MSHTFPAFVPQWHHRRGRAFSTLAALGHHLGRHLTRARSHLQAVGLSSDEVGPGRGLVQSPGGSVNAEPSVRSVYGRKAAPDISGCPWWAWEFPLNIVGLRAWASDEAEGPRVAKTETRPPLESSLSLDEIVQNTQVTQCLSVRHE